MTAHPLMCAICGETVATGVVDPCALIVVSNWRGPESDQREQQFFAHADCLRAAMHPDVVAHADVLERGRDSVD